MRTRIHSACLALPLLAAATAFAQTAPSDRQPIEPQVERRDVKLPRVPSKDFEIGAFAGVYSTENFGASAIGGVRLGYHFSEDVFMEASLAQTKVSDETFRQVLPGGVFVDRKETLRYANLSTGYNVLPGEVFIGSRHAKATALYLIGGVGTTHFVDQRRQTIDFGLGLRLLLADRVALRVDMRDHVFSLDLLGRRQTTQNLELTAGLGFHF